MLNQDAQLLLAQPEWLKVLAAYLEVQLQLPSTKIPKKQELKVVSAESVEGDEEASSEGWAPRLTQVAEVESSQLPAIHGGLIAAGFLRFELLNREAGMGYRVSPQGRAALKSVERGETASIESNGTDAENNAEESRWADAA